MLTPETQKYLAEVWGYTNVEDIDDLTLECISENANEGFPADREIIMEVVALSLHSLEETYDQVQQFKEQLEEKYATGEQADA